MLQRDSEVETREADKARKMQKGCLLQENQPTADTANRVIIVKSKNYQQHHLKNQQQQGKEEQNHSKGTCF